MQDLHCDYLSRSLERTSGTARSGGEWFRSISDRARSITRSLRVMKKVRIAHTILAAAGKGRVRSYRFHIGAPKDDRFGILVGILFLCSAHAFGFRIIFSVARFRMLGHVCKPILLAAASLVSKTSLHPHDDCE
jgi:hypothetical protein